MINLFHDKKIIVSAVVIAAMLSANGAAVSAASALDAASGSTAQGVDVSTLGATPNDSSDDTAAIQSALDQYSRVYISAGTYLINPNVSLKPKSGQTITLASSAVLEAEPTSRDTYALFSVLGVSNVTISGGKIVGERDRHQGTSGEWGYGVDIGDGSSNITVSNVTAVNFWGDGFYLGGLTGSAPVTKVVLDHVVADNNRRQGLSITNADGVVVSNSVFKNTNGTLPYSGIDVEPNDGCVTKDIVFRNIQSYGNEGYGIELCGDRGTLSGVTLSGSSFKANGRNGLYTVDARELQISDSSFSGNRFGIELTGGTVSARFVNVSTSNNEYFGVGIKNVDQSESISDVHFTGSSFFDNSQNKRDSQNGVWIATNSAKISDISFTGCRFYDDQANKTQSYGLAAASRGSGVLSNVTVDKTSTFSGNISGAYSGNIAVA